LDTILDFAKGTLFRFTFVLMVLGLTRILWLELYNVFEAYRRAGDRRLPWNYVLRRTLGWIFPVNRAFRNRPLYSLLSISFHVGLLIVPIFLLAHIQLWKVGVGVSWLALSKTVADVLTIATVLTGVGLFIGRLSSHASRFISRKQDFFWPPLLILPFLTGFLCANVALSPAGYQWLMLVHVLSAELIFVLLPFTKIAHCILIPFSTFVSNLAWKFPAETNESVSRTLRKEGAKI